MAKSVRGSVSVQVPQVFVADEGVASAGDIIGVPDCLQEPSLYKQNRIPSTIVLFSSIVSQKKTRERRLTGHE